MVRNFPSLKRINLLLLPVLFLSTLSINSSAQADVTRPYVISESPAEYSINLDAGISVAAVFNEAMNPATINSGTFELRNALTGTLINSVVTYNAANRTARLYPANPLLSLIYTVKVKGGVSGVKDLAGNAMAADNNWIFVVIPLWDNTDPTVLAVSPANGATGVNTTAQVTATFSEAMNASSINSSTFELRNPSNVIVPATVSYNSSLRKATLTPSAALATATTYKATLKGGSSGVKDISSNTLSSNYQWSFTTSAPADATPPQVSSVSPANGSTNVPVNTVVTAVFNEPMNPATINGTTVQLFNSSNATVAATVSYNAAAKTVTLTPSAPLSNISQYSARVKGGSSGVKDVAGNALAADYNWSFTTVALTLFGPEDHPSVPLIVDQPVELGVKFRSSQTGYVKGVRFYKAPGNNGTHIGHLWNSAGVMLAEATFVNETASGWQQVLFSEPVPVTANTTFIASYYSPLGMYGYTNSFFTSAVVNGPLRALADGEDGGNGVYSYASAPVFPTNSYLSTNYYTDVVFMTAPIPDNIPPTVQVVSPHNSATAVNIGTTVSGIFSESMDATTINNSTVELRTAGGSLVNAAVAYSSASNGFTLTPSVPLANSTVYTAKIKGGTSGVKDGAGNGLSADYTWTFTTADALIAPAEGPGGPILVISTNSNPFSRYATEILRAEGLNEFAAADISTVTPATLTNYDVVVLGEMTLTSAQVAMLTAWVNTGGTLIAFKPGSLLNSLFGLTASTGTLSDKYLLVNTATGPGVGIVNQTMQFHGTANLHNIVAGSGAVSVATLYSNAATATANPAVVMRNVGVNGGHAIAFTFDLARSIVYTRQGNPAWAGQKRDGQNGPIRSDDLFYGNAASDPQADWIDFNKIGIPQADEQQRLLANIILQSNLHRKPLPRFWYLPRDLKAAIVMTGDDHAINGVVERFNDFIALGPNTQEDVDNWKAVRGTAYVYPNTPITNLQAMTLQAQGFEIALHPNSTCLDYTFASLQTTFSTQLSQFRQSYPGLLASSTNRTHCLAWSDWASAPKVEYQNGVRLDVTYYYWPEVWMQNIPGMFTGSGMPMRFADADGTIIDVYQAPTQITDETDMDYTAFCNAVLDKAVGPEGYYGVFTANMHTDQPVSADAAAAIVASAQARQVPVISSRQLLVWLDARNGSSFTNLNWSNNKLSFTATARNDARNLKAMLPVNSATGQLMTITRNGSTVPFTVQTIKGISYAFFAVAAGANNYIADYGGVSVRTMEQPVTGMQNGKVAGKEATSDLADKLVIKAMPNPSSSQFQLVINSNDATPVTVRIVDIAGRIVETHQRIASSGVLRVGQNWIAGSYFAEVIQGTQRKVVKLVKVK